MRGVLLLSLTRHKENIERSAERKGREQEIMKVRKNGIIRKIEWKAQMNPGKKDQGEEVLGKLLKRWEEAGVPHEMTVR